MKVRGKTTAYICIPKVLGNVDITVQTTRVISFANIDTKAHMADTYGNGYVRGETTELEMSAVNANINLSTCTISHTEAVTILSSLKNGVSGKTITFNATTYGTLTSDEKTVATAKGWTVASA